MTDDSKLTELDLRLRALSTAMGELSERIEEQLRVNQEFTDVLTKLLGDGKGIEERIIVIEDNISHIIEEIAELKDGTETKTNEADNQRS